jgi:ABC-type Fe3+-hydroxamate transport system substrate-binding protein
MHKTYSDRMNRSVDVPVYPKRIVSLVPSLTEFLVDLGLEEELVGITKFCIHPNHVFRSKTRVGGTKNISFEKIKALAPDLIICNKEENVKEQIEQLMNYFPVWVTDIITLEDTYEMMLQLGHITGKQEKAISIANQIRAGFRDVSEKLLEEKKRKVLYLIWQNPFMAAGSANIINDILLNSGFENLLQQHPERYPQLSADEIKGLNPELILLSSEPYPFKEKHKHEFQKLLPSCKTLLVDGELFSWYGSRLILAPEYLLNLHWQINNSR